MCRLIMVTSSVLAHAPKIDRADHRRIGEDG
jgi:hypothetical protein